MAVRKQAKLLRIFIGESDKLYGKPLYEAIVDAAQEAGVVGATVLRGIESYGASRRRHTAKVLRLSEAMPLVIEIVDGEKQIEQFLKQLKTMLGEARVGAMVSLEKVEIFHFPSEQ